MEMPDNGLLSTGPKVYIHKPLLLSASIRILELLPSRDRDSPIHCKIREFALTENRHSYDALSYVWGQPTDVRPVVLGDAVLHVTVNCWSALRHLRHKYHKRMLWVDAICIDQRNTSDAIQERSKQIKLMGKVYQWAKRVVIWLGPGNDATWATLATAQALSFLSIPGQLFGIETLQRANQRLGKAVFRAANVETGTLSNKYYAELVDMMQNPWFVRVWTIQEMALARRRVVRRGDSEWSWLSFEMMQHGIMRSIGLHNWEVLERSELTQLMFTILPSRWLTFRMKWFHKVFDRSGPSRIGRELNKGLELKVLSSLMVHKATKAIDKVYSVYRILELMYIKIPEPDYNKSALEAYEETTRCWIRSRQDLTILLIAARPTSHGEGPSWVPDWGQDVPPHRARWLDPMATRPLLDNLASKGHYQASKQSRAYLQKGNSIEIPGQLPVSGKLLGKVLIGVTTKDLSRDLPPAPLDAASFNELLKDLAGAFYIWSVMVSQLTSYPNGETPVEAFYECIIGQTMEEGTKHDHDLSKESFINLHNMLHNDTQSYLWSDREIEERSDMIIGFSTHLLNIANHAFFILDNGYMGTALFNLHVDDVVFLLAGSPWPMILRRDDNGGYTFVAAAYVHRVMYGEAWPQSSDQLQDIVLV